MHKLVCLFALSTLFVSDVKTIKLVEPINLGGVHLFTVRGHNATHRSNVIYDRLRNALVPSLQSSDITVSSVNQQAVVMINDEVLVTITNEDAKFNNSTRFGLANKIQKNLSETLPSLVPMSSN